MDHCGRGKQLSRAQLRQRSQWFDVYACLPFLGSPCAGYMLGLRALVSAGLNEDSASWSLVEAFPMLLILCPTRVSVAWVRLLSQHEA